MWRKYIITRTVQHSQMEQALLQSQEQYKQLLDQFPFAIEVFCQMVTWNM